MLLDWSSRSTGSLTCHIAPACFWSPVDKASPHVRSRSFSPLPPPPPPVWGCECAAPAEPGWTAPSPPPGWRSHGTPGGSGAPPWWLPSPLCRLGHDCGGLGTRSAPSPSDGGLCAKSKGSVNAADLGFSRFTYCLQASKHGCKLCYYVFKVLKM